MSNFKWYKLDELYKMSSGISSKASQAGHGSPFISFSTVFNNYFLPDSLDSLMDTSEKEQELYSVKEGDILLTRTSEVIDELGMSCVALKDYPQVTYSGFVKRLRPLQNNKTYHKYMGFYLRSKFFRKTITNNAIMTLRASLNEEIFSYLNLYLPEYETQKTIGDFLFLLNAKIELNNKINAQLMAMAKSLYDFWFVQYDFPDANGKPYKSCGGKMVWNEELKREIPEGWEVMRLSKRIQIGSGYSFSSKKYNEAGNYKVITIKNVQDGFLYTEKVDRVDALPKNIPSYCILSKGDFLISLTGNVGRLCFVDEENLLLNQRVGKLLGDHNFLNYAYLYFLRPENRKRLEQIAGGSSQSNLSPVDATKCYFSEPEESVFKNFNAKLDPIFRMIMSRGAENKKLAELRDWLLPMLMNGQVNVG